MTTNQFLARIQELEDNLRRMQGQAHERIAELQAEVNVLLERNTALQHELTLEQRRNLILEQRLRRIWNAVWEAEGSFDEQ